MPVSAQKVAVTVKYNNLKEPKCGPNCSVRCLIIPYSLCTFSVNSRRSFSYRFPNLGRKGGDYSQVESSLNVTSDNRLTCLEETFFKSNFQHYWYDCSPSFFGVIYLHYLLTYCLKSFQHQTYVTNLKTSWLLWIGARDHQFPSLMRFWNG